jgi:hypothetical protein
MKNIKTNFEDFINENSKENEKMKNLIYTLGTNEYDSKVIAKYTDLDILLDNLKNRILSKIGDGEIDYKFIEGGANRRYVEKRDILEGFFTLIVNYNGEFYKSFSLDVSNDEVQNFVDSSLY